MLSKKLSESLEFTISAAFARAKERQHEFITIEHLLLALLDDPEANQVLRACRANIDRLRAGLAIFIDETTPQIPAHLKREVQPTIGFQRVLQRSIDQTQTTITAKVTGAQVLVAIYGEPESQAVYFLNQENVTFADVMNYLTHALSNQERPNELFQENPFSSESPLFGNHEQSFGSSDHSMDMGVMREFGPEDDLVSTYTTNLNEKARSGKTDPLIGREPEVMRAIQVLCRRTKNNPLFVGEAGVGKTAIAEGLAKMIVERRVPEPLLNLVIYSVDLGSMLAGTKYRGDFEKRFKTVLKALSRHNGAVIFIDEIHNLVGAGSATGSTMDASNLIKPLLSSGDLRCMGATTYDEYRTHFEKDSALLRRFQKIDVAEPSTDDTLKILEGLKTRFESYHNIIYLEDALKRAVELSARYMVDRHLPDKAIDVIDEAGAYQRLQPADQRVKAIGIAEIEKIVSKITRVPLEQLSQSDTKMLKNLPKKLKEKIFGQDHAIDKLSEAMKLARSGLKNPEKPVGSFLLAGPTGVGKTEVVKQLAHEIGIDLVRFDMSEYMERHTVSRLIGAPPGYIGHDQGGLLTEAIIRKPYCVLLLDEIEKAHPDIFNILLQVMDYGYLTDNEGRKADFRHVIIIMTTNAGADQLEKNSIGFLEQDNRSDGEGVIKRLFSPEFRNRLDAVIPFAHLDSETITKVVNKNLKELTDQLREKGINFSISDSAKQWLARMGYSKSMGARPMARLIEEKLKKPIVDELLFGKLSANAGNIKVGIKADELDINVAAEG